MPGIKALRKLQFGAETVPGTAVAATTIYRGNGTLEDAREHVNVQEDVGLLGGSDRVYLSKTEGKLALDDSPATFEQLPYLMQMWMNAASVADTGAGATGKIWTWTFPTTSVTQPKTYTVQGGDNQDTEFMTYTHAESIKLAGSATEAWMMSANLRGRSVEQLLSGYTTPITLPAVSEIMFGKTKLWIDDIGGVIGTTLKSATLLAATLSIETGIQAVYTANGELYFDFLKPTMPEITLEVTFEHDGTSVAEKEKWRNMQSRLVRLQAEGDPLATAGTFSKKTMRIDIAGKWEKFSKLDEQDGNDIVTGTLRAKFNSTANLFGAITVVNELATLP